MNILHIAPYYPSKKAIHAGGVCMAHEIEALQSLGHKVIGCVFYQKHYDAGCMVNDANIHCVKLTVGGKLLHCFLHPFTAPYFASRLSRKFYRKLVRIIREQHIDVVHAEYAAMGLYAKKLKKKFPSLKFNLVLHDVTLQSYMRKVENAHGIKKLLSAYQRYLIKKDETKIVKQVDCIFTWSQKDTNLVQQFYGAKNVKTINPYFGLEKALSCSVAESTRTEKSGICFMGQMGRKENEEAAIRLVKIYHTLQNKLPNVPLYIIGGNPSKQLQEFASERVVLCGHKENVEEFMAHCQLAVYPLLQGAGIKIKVLTAMALGLPTITTDVGAEGIDETGEYLILANSDEEIATEIWRVLQNNGCKHSCKEIQDFVKVEFSWDITLDAFKNCYGYVE